MEEELPILNIKDTEVHSMAAELARQTGKTLTQVVKDALRDRLSQENNPKPDQRRLVGRVLALAQRASSRPVLDPREPNEIVGYDELGIPH